MNLTRRYFLQASGVLTAYLGVSPFSALTLAAEAGATQNRVKRGKTLVVIFLRGGADGLNLVVPYGDADYAGLRESLRLEPPGQKENAAVDLDGYFGLHPRMKALAPLFKEKLAVAAHAVGYDKNTRSHFEEQDVWETGVVGNTVNSDGWLNRHLATSTGHGPIRAVTIGDNLPRILHGKCVAYAVRGMEQLTYPERDTDRATKMLAALEHAYSTETHAQRSPAMDLLSQTTEATTEGVRLLRRITDQPYEPAVPYPDTGLARQLQQVSRLIKANVGVEVAEVDYNGWDTHRDQGGVSGAFGNLAGSLADAVAAFMKDLGERADDVLLVTLTDFGRTAKENGTRGTDHGWANCMFLLGGPVVRGHAAAEQSDAGARKVVTQWPGLSTEQLHQGRDLLHTTDFRDVLGEIVSVHLGNDNLKLVLPSHQFKPVGLIA